MALQNLCLTTVVDNFERFYTAFTSQDAKLKRMLEFLQRVYSFEITQLMYDDDKLKEKYTDLVINKYLKILDTNWFANSEWKTVVAKIADIGSSIKKIHFHAFNEGKPWQEIFCYLSNVEVFIFHSDCDDEILVCIAKYCPNVTEIDIKSSCDVTQEGLKSLCKKKNGKVPCSKLKKLYIRLSTVTDPVAMCLIKNLPSLEHFDYYDLPLVLYSMHKEDLSKPDKIPTYKLTKLDFFSASHNPHFTNLLKVCFSVCPFLTTLSLNIKEPEQLDCLKELSRLEVLHLDYEQQNFLDINNFLKSKRNNLTSLTISNCSLSVLTLAESCPTLKNLCMYSSNFEQCDDKLIPQFHNLKHFNISDLHNLNNVKPVFLVLSSSPKLESIGFIKCNLAELKAGILKCCEHCLLKKIDFSCSSADKSFVMDVLLTCRSLETLNLEGCGFDSSDENEIMECAEIMPNIPDVYISNQLSISDYDDYGDFFEDYYDFDDEDYDDYDDYLNVDDEEDDDDDEYNADYYI